MSTENQAATQTTETKTATGEKSLGELGYQEFKRARENPKLQAEDKSAEVATATTETSADTDTADTEESEGAGDSSQETEGSEGEQSDKTAQDGKTGKRKSGFQRRISKLRGELSAKDQELGYLRSELDKARGTSAATDQKAASSTAATDGGRPNKDAFENHDDYVEALADWKYDQRSKADKASQALAEAKTQVQKKTDTHIGRVQEFVKSHPDFTDVIAELDDGPKVSLTVQEAILESENGPELMYQLAKNRKEFERINALTPIKAAVEIGKFQARFAKPSETESQTKKTTRAPAPVEPIGAKSSGSTVDPEKMGYQAFKKWREKSLRGA